MAKQLTYKQFIKSKKFKKLPRIHRIKRPGIYAVYKSFMVLNKKEWYLDLIIVDEDLNWWKFSTVANFINPFLNEFKRCGGVRKLKYQYWKVEFLGDL